QQDLRHFDLVTLAACETAITGSETITDEYIGLVSAFLSAGARCVLSTLWQVESEASMVLIVEFYRNLDKGMTPAAALRQAQSFLAHADRQTLKNWLSEALELVTSSSMKRLLRQRQKDIESSELDQPFSHPYFWAPFTLTGL
ncbi:MAG: CHAT domain-containing protein, partial [Phormidesmis sp.]